MKAKQFVAVSRVSGDKETHSSSTVVETVHKMLKDTHKTLFDK